MFPDIRHYALLVTIKVIFSEFFSESLLTTSKKYDVFCLYAIDLKIDGM